MTIEQTLKDRGEAYGSFEDFSRLSQSIKREMTKGKWWVHTSPSQREAFEMIAHKIARLLNGGAHHADSWHDIAGYALLIEKELNHVSD